MEQVCFMAILAEHVAATAQQEYRALIVQIDKRMRWGAVSMR